MDEGEGERTRGNGSCGGTKRENKERDISIEGVIVGLGRNLMLGKLPGNHKDDPS